MSNLKEIFYKSIASVVDRGAEVRIVDSGLRGIATRYRNQQTAAGYDGQHTNFATDVGKLVTNQPGTPSVRSAFVSVYETRKGITLDQRSKGQLYSKAALGLSVEGFSRIQRKLLPVFDIPIQKLARQIYVLCSYGGEINLCSSDQTPKFVPTGI